ncbi:MAG: twin-arginine translocase subunit TatB [Xanthobacteraceae bacterium]|nr:MAG: twin-arginine translocase subunit TatB [Xanthobacteraceae bacterium]
MFDIGWGEMVVIGVVALIAIGPKELPGVLRMVGQWIGKARRMASEFQGHFQEAMREAEMAEVKKEFDAATQAAGDIASINPVAAMQREFEASMNPAEAPPEAPALAAPEPAVPVSPASEPAAPEDLPQQAPPPVPEAGKAS